MCDEELKMKKLAQSKNNIEKMEHNSNKITTMYRMHKCLPTNYSFICANWLQKPRQHAKNSKEFSPINQACHSH